MSLREIRKSRKLTQKELAEMSGVNFRSLQDYEQGHKKLTSASGDILLRISTVLGCSLEELLMTEMFEGNDLVQTNKVDISMIQSRRFYCEKYRTAGRFVCNGKQLAVLFYYEGEQYTVPFKAHFTYELLPWLDDAAVLKMEEKIENILFEKYAMNWG